MGGGGGRGVGEFLTFTVTVRLRHATSRVVCSLFVLTPRSVVPVVLPVQILACGLCNIEQIVLVPRWTTWTRHVRLLCELGSFPQQCSPASVSWSSCCLSSDLHMRGANKSSIRRPPDLVLHSLRSPSTRFPSPFGHCHAQISPTKSCGVRILPRSAFCAMDAQASRNLGRPCLLSSHPTARTTPFGCLCVGRTSQRRYRGRSLMAVSASPTPIPV